MFLYVLPNTIITTKALSVGVQFSDNLNKFVYLKKIYIHTYMITKLHTIFKIITVIIVLYFINEHY